MVGPRFANSLPDLSRLWPVFLQLFYAAPPDLCLDFSSGALTWRSGFTLHWRDCLVAAVDLGVGGRVRIAGARTVTLMYGLCALVCAALFIYLIAALIRAEHL
jgi:K+-transporting ATPase KdpF subunit